MKVQREAATFAQSTPPVDLAMPSQPPSGSGASSPYLPQTDEERTEREHQQQVDLQLATSMSRGLDSMTVARSRSRSGGQELQRDNLGETYRSLRDAQVGEHTLAVAG